jgi:hypothetical protein
MRTWSSSTQEPNSNNDENKGGGSGGVKESSRIGWVEVNTGRHLIRIESTESKGSAGDVTREEFTMIDIGEILSEDQQSQEGGEEETNLGSEKENSPPAMLLLA